jgi:hypothetical protein
VGHARVELRGLAGLEDEVLLAQHHAQPPVEDVQPLVALVRLRLRLTPGGARRDDDLVRLDAARPAAERQQRHAVRLHRAKADPGVAGRRGVDQLVERHAVRPRQRQEQLERRLAVAGL